MDLEDELLADLGSDSDESQHEELPREETESMVEMEKDITMKEDGSDFSFDINSILDRLINSGKDITTQELISRLDLGAIKDIKSISKVSVLLQPVLNKIDEYNGQSIKSANTHNNAEYDFLVRINDVTAVINNELQLIHSFITTHYGIVFPELSTLIPNAVDYVKIILAIKQDLRLVSDDKLKQFLTGDKILVITISANQQLKNGFKFNEQDMAMILEACELFLQLNGSKMKIMEYISARLSVFAPNVTAIVGAQCAAQLMTSVGGIGSLAATPSCNIAAIGSKRAVGIGMGVTGVRQQGFLYDSPLVQSCPQDIQKQAMRIVSAKLILAARVDYSQGSSNGAMGAKWLEEIEKKLEKLLEPPENKGVKALPLPMDKPSKKRGGKRFRKEKEKYKLSDLGKAQNRLAFGEQEDSYVDGFGEEIGLGMANRAMNGGSGLRSISINNNTKAQMSKKMANRLQGANKALVATTFNAITDDSINLINPTQRTIQGEQPRNKWLMNRGGTLLESKKRRSSVVIESDKTKQQK